MLPGFTASASIYRSQHLYREIDSFPGTPVSHGSKWASVALSEALFSSFGSTHTGDGQAVPALLGSCPSGFSGIFPNCYPNGLPGGDHCASACAQSCQTAQTEELYLFCFQQCYSACAQPSGGGSGGSCQAPRGSCNPTGYCECVKQNANLNFGQLPQPCGLLYGPCQFGTTCCEGTCVNTDTDPTNCGGCGVEFECQNNATCCRGVCCGNGMGCCPYTGRTAANVFGNYACVWLWPDGQPSGETDNAFNCGLCGYVCPNNGPANSHAVCLPPVFVPGKFALPTRCSYACNDEFTLCGEYCVNFQSDSNNCGSCGNACAAGASCVGGSCQCPPGPTSQKCGNCGTQTRACNRDGSWSAWSACSGQGACAPGTTQHCGANGTQNCNSSCQWGACSCTGPSSQHCGNCGTQTRTCNNGTWSSWSACSGQGACAPGTTQQCDDGIDVQTCNSSCQWGACNCPSGQLPCGNNCYDPSSGKQCCVGGDICPTSDGDGTDLFCCGDGIACDDCLDPSECFDCG
jgi:hypothetical protein